jgi:hypothetical protein
MPGRTTPRQITGRSLTLRGRACNVTLRGGAVAQLGEHKAGSLGVRGSSPLSSTKSFHDPLGRSATCTSLSIFVSQSGTPMSDATLLRDTTSTV